MNLVTGIPDNDSNRPDKCLECGAKAIYWKLSLMEKTKCGLCEEHKNWTMAMTFTYRGEVDKAIPPRRR